MPLISRADFARLASVSRAAITQAVTRKNLAVEADGTINTDLPINAKWLTEKRGKKAPAAPRVKSPKGDTVSPDEPDDPENEFDEVLSATVEAAAEKLKFTIARRKNAEADTYIKNLRIAKEKGILVTKESVRRDYAAFDAAIKNNFRDMPRRISAQVTALAASSGQADVEKYLEQQVSAAILRAHDAADALGFV